MNRKVEINFESKKYFQLSNDSKLLYCKYVTDYRKPYIPACFRLRNDGIYKRICRLSKIDYDSALCEILESELLIIDRDHAYLVGLIKYFLMTTSCSLPRGAKLEWIKARPFGERWLEEFEATLPELPTTIRKRILIGLGREEKEKGCALPYEILEQFAAIYASSGHGKYFTGNVPELSMAKRLSMLFSIEDLKHRMRQFFNDNWIIENRLFTFTYFTRFINKYSPYRGYEDDPEKARYWEIVNAQKQA